MTQNKQNIKHFSQDGFSITDFFLTQISIWFHTVFGLEHREWSRRESKGGRVDSGYVHLMNSLLYGV